MSQSVWIGRINRSATYEELWAFLTNHCGALESLEHVPHKGFAIAIFVNPEDAARTRNNQTLKFHGATLWMDSVWETGSKRPPKSHTPTIFNTTSYQTTQAPKQIVLKRHANGRPSLSHSTHETTHQSHPRPHQPPSQPSFLLTQLPPILARPHSQLLRPQIQPIRARQTLRPPLPLLAPQLAPRVHPTTRLGELPIRHIPLEEDAPEPREQHNFKRRREEQAESRLAPNFSISIDNTGVPDWGEEDSEPAIGSLYPTSSARFSQLSAQPSIVLQPYETQAGVTTYYDDYASSKILHD